MGQEYWFYFDLYASGVLVGTTRVFKISGARTRQEAKEAAELEWLASGGLGGTSCFLTKGAPEPNMAALRDHEDSPTKE